MVRTGSIGLRIDETVKAALEKAAADDRRSVASYVEILIIRDLESKGLLPKAGGSKAKK